jgi:hypothetical protein
MKPSNCKPKSTGHRFVMPGAVVGLFVGFVLLAAAPAFAVYQQVSTFGGSFVVPVPPEPFPEQDELGGVSSMAVNEDGAGGVPVGTVYAVGQGNPSIDAWKVARFSPAGEFQLAWTPSRRCGPEVPPEPPDTHYPVCETKQQGATSDAVAVDQATGDVYVYSGFAGHVWVYNPDGSHLIAEFGEKAAPGETTAASPEKFHGDSGTGGMTVDSAGNVYVLDVNFADHFRSRLMVFQPQTPGDYEHYVYAGESHDISPGAQEPSGRVHPYPSQPVVDDHGDVYVDEAGSIDEFEPGRPTTPICTFAIPDEALRAMTVDPANGEVFYYDYKARKIYQLHSCNSEGKFVEVEGGAFGVSPQRGNIYALVFNPILQYEPSRAAGVLYAATPDPSPTNGGGGGEPGESALGYIFAPPVQHEPVVETEEISNVSSSSALLGAVVNPKGANTRYHFQYLTAAAYEANEPGERFAGAVEVPVGGAPVGGGSTGVAVSVTASGLAPETEYYYRVVAVSAEGTVDGSAMSFGTFPVQASGLPDGRVYELVSPVDKHGGEVFPVNPFVFSCTVSCKGPRSVGRFPYQSAPDGEGVVYDGSAFGGEGPVGRNEYLSRRTSTGWQTTALSPTQQNGGSGIQAEFDAFDASLDHAVVYQEFFGLTPGALAEYANLYSQPTSDPSALSSLLLQAPPNRLPGGAADHLHLTYAGASVDMSRIFFSANDALTGETPFAPAAVDGGNTKNNLYEWSEGGLRLVNVDPGNASTTPGAAYGARSKEQYVRGDVAHAVSADGLRVFWSSEAGQVYVRENGERTVEIPDHSGEFRAAAADGSKVLLSDGRVYGDLESESPVQEGDLSGGQGGFQGIIGQSEDLSRVYFVDTAVLDETANAQGAKAQIGQDNLYVWHEGTSVFIATLLQADDDDANSAGMGDWALAPVQRTAEASPDGRWVAFLSEAELTGRGNVGSCKLKLNKSVNEYVTSPCKEVFIYDSVSGRLTCVSCSPSGSHPLGNSRLPSIFGEEWISQARYLDDGGRLLFDSQESLSLADTNHGVEDVYEYEPAGVGSCAREGGCVSLISGGSGATDSNFLAMDSSGKNVFFTTRDQLVGGDHDQLVDVYDAREGGGLAAQSEPSPQGCRGEACQQSPAVPPPLVESMPGSFAFTGPGNMIESTSPAPVKPKVKALSRAQQQARALKACRKKPRKARASCEKSVRKRYAVKANVRKIVVNDRKRSK